MRLGIENSHLGLCGEANYLKAEALRLLVDFENDREQAKSLRHGSIKSYEHAIDMLNGDPRPIRGRARTIEILGDCDTANFEFKKATGLATVREAQTKSDLYSFSHESIRSLRHQINCLCSIHAQTNRGSRDHQRQAQEIRRLLEQSYDQHDEVLRMFRPMKGWWAIEWLYGVGSARKSLYHHRGISSCLNLYVVGDPATQRTDTS